VFVELKLTDVYTYLAKLSKVAVTVPVTSASAERVHSKLKLVKSALRSSSANDRMSDQIQIYLVHDIANGLGLSELVSEFALKPRTIVVTI